MAKMKMYDSSIPITLMTSQTLVTKLKQLQNIAKVNSLHRMTLKKLILQVLWDLQKGDREYSWYNVIIDFLWDSVFV